MTALLEAALDHARRGFAVIPNHHRTSSGACSCGKGADCTSAGKHPRLNDWTENASADEAVVRAWWEQWPQANIGIATGEKSGCFALDVDPRHGGMESLRTLEMKYGLLPMTVEAITGGGGRHILFRHSSDVRNSVGKTNPLGDGLDVRGVGGQIIAPGSVHASGHLYTWDPAADPDSVKIAAAPDWLLDLIRSGNAVQPCPVPVPTKIPDGERDNTLYRMACSLRAKGLERPEIEAALLAMNQFRCVPPLPEEQVREKAAAACKHPPGRSARYLGQAPGSNGNGKHQAPSPSCPPLEPGGVPRCHSSDYRNAERLVSLHGAEIRYCWQWAKWLVWDGKRWKVDDTGAIVRKAKETTRSIYAEAALLEDPEQRRALVKWAVQSEARDRIGAMIDLARSEPGIAVTTDELDAHPYLLTCQNGTFDLWTGVLREHRREDLGTKICPVPYDPQADCPLFRAFLERVLPDPEVRNFVKKAMGYSATGDTGEEKVFMPFGAGRNGKSKLLAAVEYALGDYAKSTRPETFMAKKGDAIPNDVATLVGARFIPTRETEEGKRLDVQLVKQLSGGDTMTARFMRSEFFNFKFVGKVWFSVNHKPVIRDTTESIWERIMTIPFTVYIPPAERDRGLEAKLQAEAAGVLRWIIEGCAEWRRDGLVEPDAVRQATRAYRDEMDVLAGFIHDCCTEAPDAREWADALYGAYKPWAERGGEYVVSKTVLGTKLKERGYEPRRGTGGHRYWIGIALKTELKTESDSASAAGGVLLEDEDPFYRVTPPAAVTPSHSLFVPGSDAVTPGDTDFGGNGSGCSHERAIQKNASPGVTASLAPDSGTTAHARKQVTL